MENTTIFALVAVAGIALFAMSGDKTEKVCEPLERDFGRTQAEQDLSDEEALDEITELYDREPIPQETRPDDRALMEFFRSMTERYSDRRLQPNDHVGGINKRFASICSAASYYLEDKQFSYEQLTDIQSEVKILENMAITLDAITQGVTGDTAFDFHGELWEEKDLDRLNNTMQNYLYIMGQLVKAGIIEEHDPHCRVVNFRMVM